MQFGAIFGIHLTVDTAGPTVHPPAETTFHATGGRISVSIKSKGGRGCLVTLDDASRSIGAFGIENVDVAAKAHRRRAVCRESTTNLLVANLRFGASDLKAHK